MIDGYLSSASDDKIMIEAAFDHWMAETCLIFTSYDEDQHGSDAHRLYFTAGSG